MHNPYYDEFRQIMNHGERDEYGRLKFTERARREYMTHVYSWAIPDEEGCKTIAKYGPVVEVGSGSGYWAYCLAQFGCDVATHDIAPVDEGQNVYHRVKRGAQSWYPVTQVQADDFSYLDVPERSLMLCWPCYDEPVAVNALRAYTGDTLIYIGEGRGGCTGDDEFHEVLAREWTEVETVFIPSWPYISDMLKIYRRA